MRVGRVLFTCLLGVAAACASPAPPPVLADVRPPPGPPPAPSLELQPGVILGERDVWVAGADGELKAFDFSTGALRWSSSEAAWPLLATSDELLSVTEQGTLVVLRTRDGGVERSCATSRNVGFLQGLRRSRTVRGAWHGGRALVLWTEAEHWGKGVAPPPQWRPEHAAGGWFVDLASCAAVPPLDGEPSPHELLQGADPDTWEVDGVRFSLRRNAAPDAGSLELLVESPGQSRTWTLHRQDGPLPRAWVQRSADGRHVAFVPPGRADPPTTWSSATGEVVEGLPWLRTAPFVVRGDLVLTIDVPYPTPLHPQGPSPSGMGLRVSELGGDTLWQSAIRGTEYRGPYPP